MRSIPRRIGLAALLALTVIHAPGDARAQLAPPLLKSLPLTDTSAGAVNAGWVHSVLGSLANKMPGTPSSINLFRGLQDVVDFYAYGGKADGSFGSSGGYVNRHPLSGVTSVNGVNTTGYTLAQWQSFYAGCNDGKGNNVVKALTDELDELAIQCVINRKTGDGGLMLPAGIMWLTRPIISGQYALSVQGPVGQRATKLVQTAAGQDGWHHGTDDAPYHETYESSWTARLSMSNFQILCGNIGTKQNRLVCGTGLKASFNAATAGFYLTDFDIQSIGVQDGNFWHDGIWCNNCSLTVMTRVNIGGAAFGADATYPVTVNDIGTGIAYVSLNGRAGVQFSHRDLTTNGWKIGVSTTTGAYCKPGTSPCVPLPNSDQEGFLFDNWQANGVFEALVTLNNTADPDGRSPQYVITNGQFAVFSRWLRLAQIDEVFISNNLVYGGGAGLATGGTQGYTQVAPGGNVQGTATAGSKTVTLTAAAPAGLAAGVPFFGSGIGQNNFVASVSGSTVTLKNAAASNSTNPNMLFGVGQPGFDAVELIRMEKVVRGTIRDNNLTLTPSANIGSFATVIGGRDLYFDNNKAYASTNQSFSWMWYNADANNLRVIEKNSFWDSVNGWFVPVVAGLNGAALGTRFHSFYAALGTVVRSDSSLQFDSSAVLTLDANKSVSLYVPPVFGTAPSLVHVTNGDVAANPAFCGPIASSVTASAVTIACPTATAGASVRVNYSLIGRY